MTDTITFDRVLKEIKENKKLREEGKDLLIPFPFPRFANYVPGIQKGRYYICTASSKIGKTQITDFLFVYNPYYFTKERTSNIKVRIFYFTLEMSKEDKIKQAIAYKLYKDKGIILSTDKISSLFKNYTLTNEVLNEIESYKDWFHDYENTVTYVDSTRNPYGIYRYMREYAYNNGQFINKRGDVIPLQLIKQNDEEAVKSVDYYQPNDPNEYVIVVTDHVSILTCEKEKTLHQTIDDFSSEYCLKLRDRFKYIIVNVQQQAAASESLENFKADKLQPSANGLGDNKLTARDADCILGLFAPSRHKIRQYEGYDITKLQDNHRELSVIMNRRGNSVSTQLYFNGAISYFKELPPANEMTEEIYNNIINTRI